MENTNWKKGAIFKTPTFQYKMLAATQTSLKQKKILVLKKQEENTHTDNKCVTIKHWIVLNGLFHTQLANEIIEIFEHAMFAKQTFTFEVTCVNACA